MKTVKRGLFEFVMGIITLASVLTAAYYYKKSSHQSVIVTPTTFNCNVCKFNPKIQQKDSLIYKVKTIKIDKGPDTAKAIYWELYDERDKYKLEAENYKATAELTEQRMHDSISDLKVETAYYTKVTRGLSFTNDAMKEELANVEPLRQYVDTIHTFSYEKSYVNNPELDQVLVQLRAAWTFGKPGFGIGGGMEYKFERYGINGAVFYNPITDKVTEGIGARYDLFRTRVK